MKTAMVLTALAALAISGNAMALTTPAGGRPITLDTGSFAGNLVINPLPKNVAPTAAAPLGSCRYDAAWFIFGTFGTPQACSFLEPKQPGHLSCNANRLVDFSSPNVVSLAGCSGYDDNGDLFDSSVTIAGNELAGFGVLGTVTFDGLIPQVIHF